MMIYVHLPFCLSHCIYCDFYVELKATETRRRAYLDALLLEIRHALEAQPNSPIETLYLGGGTPALFPATELAEVLTCLQAYAPFSPHAEITLEANPEGAASALAEYRALGINRLSVGVQSLQPNELKRLSRVHSRAQVLRFVESARQAGFENLSIDLMYGIPEQTLERWLDTLRQALDLGVEHISMYGLKVEPETRLDRLVAQGRMQVPTDETTVEMFFEGIALLEQHGYRQYEISNLSKPGFESRHNLGYWDNRDFWGFGVSAHGYMHSQRYENPRSLESYLANPTERAEIHPCSAQEKRENALIFGLRKREGVSIPTLEAQYGFHFQETYGQAIQRYLDAGMLTLENGQLSLPLHAVPLSNEVLTAFLS